MFRVFREILQTYPKQIEAFATHFQIFAVYIIFTRFIECLQCISVVPPAAGLTSRTPSSQFNRGYKSHSNRDVLMEAKMTFLLEMTLVSAAEPERHRSAVRLVRIRRVK